MNKREKKIKRPVRVPGFVLVLVISLLFGEFTYAAEIKEVSKKKQQDVSQEGQDNTEMQKLLIEYEDYRQRFEQIQSKQDIEENGFRIIEEQIFPMETKCFGTVSLIPAIEKKYHRLALFLAKEDEGIVYKTDGLEMNNRSLGEMKQPVRGLAAVSFQELNRDGRMDIVIIAACQNDAGAYAGKTYKVGEVLFQGENGFYRDYRLSDKINRFGMNKSVECITAFVRDGHSTEFLYTATTKQELLDNGFQVAQEQCYFRQFEKLGRLEVVPGTYNMANFSTFMIYLVNEQGYIVWSFQPMGDYDNLYALKGMTCKDIDGDGMKDILVLAKYSYESGGTDIAIKSDYSVYYQRTNGFYEDTEIKKTYPCGDEDTVAELVEKARAYWGWSAQQ